MSYEPHLALEQQIIHVFEYQYRYYGILISEELCDKNCFGIVLFSGIDGSNDDIMKVLSSPFIVQYYGHMQTDRTYILRLNDQRLYDKIIDNLNHVVPDGRTLYEVICNTYINDIKDRCRGESMSILNFELLQHYILCKEYYLECINKKRKGDKNMNDYRKQEVDPLKEQEVMKFNYCNTSYGLVINYDTCLNKLIHVVEYNSTFEALHPNNDNGYITSFDIYLVSGYILIPSASPEMFDKCTCILNSKLKDGRTVLETIYDIYIDCLTYDTIKIDENLRYALRSSYTIDKKTYLDSLEKCDYNNNEDKKEIFSLDAIQMFRTTHPEKYYFIKSPDVREYLKSINHQFNLAETMFLIYNSHLGYVEKMDAMASELVAYKVETECKADENMIDYEWLEEQVNERIGYMTKILELFAANEPNTVYSVEYLSNIVISGPLFTTSEDAISYALKNNHSKNNFHIIKNRINTTSEVNSNILCGVALYDNEGILLNCTVPTYEFLSKSNKERFETDVTVNIPHPFEKGNIVTDGSTIYYVKESPINISKMRNNIDYHQPKFKFDRKNNNFCIKCYCFGSVDNDTNAEDIIVLNCDIRNLTFVSGIDANSNELARVASILRCFTKDCGNSFDIKKG